MDDTSSSANNHLVQECLIDNQRKIRKIRNIKALLKKNYFCAKQSLSEALTNVQLEILHDLEEILQKKLNSLDEIEKKLEESSSFLKDSIMNSSESNIDVSQIMQSLPADSRFLSYLSLEFVAEDLKTAKKSLGFIKCSPILPEDLKMIVDNKKEFEMGTDLKVWVKGDKPWYPLLIHSLSGYAEYANGKKVFPKILDENDGSYIFLFRLIEFSKYVIQVTLYDRSIKDSPAVIEIESNESKKRKEILAMTSTPEIFETNKKKENFITTTNLNNEENYNDKTCLQHKEENPTVSKMSCVSQQYTSIIQENSNVEKYEDDYWCTNLSNEKTIENEKDEILDGKSKLENNDKIAAIKACYLATISKHTGVDLDFPIGVSVNHNKDIIICDTGHHRVLILDQTGKSKVSFEHKKEGKKLCRPSAVVITGNENFVVKDNSGLHLYDRNGNFIRSIGEKVLGRPFGLAITEDEKLITLNETYHPHLFVFNKDGQMESNNLYSPLMARPLNSKCRFMASFSNELVVSDLGLSTMYKTTIDGSQYISRFGQLGNAPGCMIEPSGITLDAKGTMLIGDSKNDRIQIFDWEGEYLGGVNFTRPIRRPSDICLTKDGHLYVLNYLDHSLAIYKLNIDE